MRQGMLQRAAVAILLMVSLLLPAGTCRSQSHAAKHECCAEASRGITTVQANCCTVRASLPAIVDDRAVRTPDLLTVAAASISRPASVSVREPIAEIAVVEYPPPPGASILRI